MKDSGYKKGIKIGFGRIGMLLVLPFIVLVIAYVVYKLFFLPDPVVKGMESFNYLPLNKTVTLMGENLRSIDISVNQNEKQINLLTDTADVMEKTFTLQLSPKDLELDDGPAVIVIKAKAGFLKEVEYKINSIIDTVPPILEVLKSPSSVNQGSAGIALLRARDADSVFVKINDHMFKAVPVPEMQTGPQAKKKPDAEIYRVFFPAPFDVKEGDIFYAVAKDIAGNRNIKSLPAKLNAKKHKTSSINIDDSFINHVVAPLLNKTSISDPEAAFKKVNEELRNDARKTIFDIVNKISPVILWEGRFLQLKNSKVMAVYGDKRTYLYNGKTISGSVHLGFDLASFSNSPVEAANAGIVRFAGDLGIYGNAVIIDHGLGLMSLYGHLSVMMVKEGQEVKKGEIIARTGSTGLAGGDHLHFAIFIHGYEVSPLYWWDPHWIEVNVLPYLKYQFNN